MIELRYNAMAMSWRAISMKSGTDSLALREEMLVVERLEMTRHRKTIERRGDMSHVFVGGLADGFMVVI